MESYDSTLKYHINTPCGISAFLSKAPLNVAFHAGDSNKEEIKENRQRLISPLRLENLAFLNQVHSNGILKANSGGFLGDGDGIIIDKKGIMGLIMIADCNPILLFDTKQKILILLHAGRKGVECGIISKAFRILRDDYKSKTSDIYAFVGASIRECCYEVTQEVFTNNLLQKGRILKNGKIFLDLIVCIKEEFKKAKFENFTIMPTCTCCNLEYFSYRRDKNCGRFGLFATIV